LLQKHSGGDCAFPADESAYRSSIEYSDDRLHEIRRSLESFYPLSFERFERIAKKRFYGLEAPKLRSSTGGGNLDDLRTQYLAHMDDDFQYRRRRRRPL